MYPMSIIKFVGSVASNWDLLITLAKRDVLGRYRGSVLGVFWSFINPLTMLLLYTFMFSVIFKARWGVQAETVTTKSEFAIIIFAGLLVFNFFSEVISKSPTLIIANSNYVKKVIFPLEILSLAAVLSALFHLLISFIVWLIFYSVILGAPPITVLLFPIAMLPAVFFSLGLSWILASTGVYIRDIGQIIGTILTAMMFLSPVFYPLSAIPNEFQYLFKINPMTDIMEIVRGVLYWGFFDESTFFVALIVTLIFCWLGYTWFQATRRGFADVI
ncbi:MAG: ABC transporter permease [Gammaproteobacteria bacterium]|nr:MAG: ABC transporter permease [Gammaproteobacteria bacterium]